MRFPVEPCRGSPLSFLSPQAWGAVKVSSNKWHRLFKRTLDDVTVRMGMPAHADELHYRTRYESRATFCLSVVEAAARLAARVRYAVDGE